MYLILTREIMSFFCSPSDIDAHTDIKSFTVD